MSKGYHASSTYQVQILNCSELVGWLDKNSNIESKLQISTCASGPFESRVNFPTKYVLWRANYLSKSCWLLVKTFITIRDLQKSLFTFLVSYFYSNFHLLEFFFSNDTLDQNVWLVCCLIFVDKSLTNIMTLWLGNVFPG